MAKAQCQANMKHCDLNDIRQGGLSDPLQQGTSSAQSDIDRFARV